MRNRRFVSLYPLCAKLKYTHPPHPDLGDNLIRAEGEGRVVAVCHTVLGQVPVARLPRPLPAASELRVRGGRRRCSRSARHSPTWTLAPTASELPRLAASPTPSFSSVATSAASAAARVSSARPGLGLSVLRCGARDLPANHWLRAHGE